MFKIEKKDYGLKFTFSGFIAKEEMESWSQEALSKLEDMPKGFGVLVNMLEMKPTPQDAQIVMEEAQKKYKEAGMSKSCMVLAHSITKLQFKRIAKNTGIYEWERYLDIETTPNWEEVGENWIKHSIDPDNLD